MNCLGAMVFLVLATSLPAAPVPKELKADFKLEGLWLVESIVSNGTPVVAENPEYWTVDAKSVVMMHEGRVPQQGKSGHLQLTLDAAGSDVANTRSTNAPSHFITSPPA